MPFQHRHGHVLPPLVGLHRPGSAPSARAPSECADFSSSSPAISLHLIAQALEARLRRAASRAEGSASAGRTAWPPRPPGRAPTAGPRPRATVSATASGDKPAQASGLAYFSRRAAAAARRSCRGSSPRPRRCSSVGESARRTSASSPGAVSGRSGSLTTSPCFCSAPLVQLADQLQPRLEQPLAERLTQRALGGRDVLAEELEVLAVVEDVEELPCAGPARTGPGTGACRGRASARTWSSSAPA